MTLLIFVTLLLTVSLAVLTVMSGKLRAKKSLVVNAAIAGAGVVALAIFVIVFGITNTSAEAALAESNFRYFLKASLILAGIFMFLTMIPTLMLFVEDKPSGYSGFLRKVFPTMSSAILLMIALLAYPLTRQITSTIGIFIYCVGVSEAMIMRLPYAVSDIKRLLSEKQKSQKNKKGRERSRRKG